MQITDKKNFPIILIFFILIGFFFRFYQLNFENYWLDEMVSFWVANPDLSFKDTLSRNNHIDQTPPLFNLILKIYFIFFGYDPNIGRHVPLFFGILSIPVLGILSYQIQKNKSFLVTVFLKFVGNVFK